MVVFALNSCYERNRDASICIYSLYLLGKLGLGITMIYFIQKYYNEDWNNNKCENLKSLSLFWLIWNYIIIGLTFIFALFYFIRQIYLC